MDGKRIWIDTDPGVDEADAAWSNRCTAT